MKPKYIEPELIAIFRGFTFYHLLVVVVLAFRRLSDPRLQIRVSEFIEPLLLLLLLSFPFLRRRRENLFWVVLILIATIGPMLIQMQVLNEENAVRERSLFWQSWTSMLVLMLPLIIIAYHNGFRETIVFCIGMAGLNLILIRILKGKEILYSDLLVMAIILRTVTLLIIGWLVVQLLRVQRTQKQALIEANTRLIQFAYTLEQLAITQERNRLARELHDTLAHTLTAVAVQLEAVNITLEDSPDKTRARLRKSIDLVRTGLVETRRALHDLRANPLDDLGLALAIRQLAEETADRAALTLDTQVGVLPNSLSREVEQTIYRIAQETFTNVIRHAHASRLEVKLALQGSTLVLQVSDDGSGFSVETVKSKDHWGIKGMQERAALINATLEINSMNKQGTTIRLSIGVGT